MMYESVMRIIMITWWIKNVSPVAIEAACFVVVEERGQVGLKKRKCRNIRESTRQSRGIDGSSWLFVFCRVGVLECGRRAATIHRMADNDENTGNTNEYATKWHLSMTLIHCRTRGALSRRGWVGRPGPVRESTRALRCHFCNNGERWIPCF